VCNFYDIKNIKCIVETTKTIGNIGNICLMASFYKRLLILVIIVVIPHYSIIEIYQI